LSFSIRTARVKQQEEEEEEEEEEEQAAEDLIWQCSSYHR
jgi:hypothetical protein